MVGGGWEKEAYAFLSIEGIMDLKASAFFLVLPLRPCPTFSEEIWQTVTNDDNENYQGNLSKEPVTENLAGVFGLLESISTISNIFMVPPSNL